MVSDHDEIADRLARKLKTKHRSKGVDIVAQGRAMEVAVTEDDVYQSIDQLKRSRAAKKYVAVPADLIPKAKELLEGTGIGVMDTRGNIKKRFRKKTS